MSSHRILFTVLLVGFALFLYALDMAIARLLHTYHTYYDPIARVHRDEEIYAEHLYRFAEFGKMSSGFFHDLMTPLTSMSLYVEQLKTTASHEVAGVSHVSRELDNVLDAADRMSRFIRVVRKQLEPRAAPEVFDIAETIRTALSIVAYKARALSVDVHFEGVSTLQYYGYAARLYQIIINLICNALDACECDAVSVKSVTVSLRADADQIVLTVRDTGVGISAEAQSKIFEPFFTTKHARNGLGIGLAITKEIVERDFKGTITVASSEGRGSVFTLIFPTSLSFLEQSFITS